MSKLILLATAAVVGVTHYALSPQGTPVELQTTSPGTAQTGHLNITGTATVGLLKSQGTVFGASTAPTGFAYGGFFTAASNQGRGFYGYASSPTGLTYGGFFQNASSTGRAVYGLATATSGTNYGGYFQSASSDGRGLLGVPASPTGTTFGVYGTAVSPSGFGVYSEGRMHATGLITGPGGRFETNAEGQSPVVGISTNLSSSAAAVLGQSASIEGTGVYGNATHSSGPTFGVYGRAASANGYGVFSQGRMHATGVISGNGSGLTGLNAASISTGVLNEARLPVPMNLVGNVFNTILTVQNTRNDINSDAILAFSNGSGIRCYGIDRGIIAEGFMGVQADGSRFGVHGTAEDATGVTYGVLGQSLSAQGWAIFATGAFGASGPKSFRIDHPTDPENKYLLHYAAESPLPQNFYVGNVKTDANGKAWVDLPDYFSEINTNFKYQLTVVRDDESPNFVQVQVGKKIRDGRFMIMTSAPNTEVSWRVDADRNDPYVRNRPPKDVIEKVGPEKGKYQHPEFYGFGADRGMNPGMAREKAGKRPNP